MLLACLLTLGSVRIINLGHVWPPFRVLTQLRSRRTELQDICFATTFSGKRSEVNFATGSKEAQF